jgi:hypothetical protein
MMLGLLMPYRSVRPETALLRPLSLNHNITARNETKTRLFVSFQNIISLMERLHLHVIQSPTQQYSLKRRLCSTEIIDMETPGTPSNAELAVRRKLEKRFTTLYAFTNNCTTPSKEQINKHISYEMHLSKVFTLSSGFEQDVWDMVYDQGVEAGADERLNALCDEWKVPEASLACRNKVKVLSTCFQSNSATLTDATLDKVL